MVHWISQPSTVGTLRSSFQKMLLGRFICEMTHPVLFWKKNTWKPWENTQQLVMFLSPGIDAVIMPVVSRNTIKRGNKRVVKLGDKEIVLNDPRLVGKYSWAWPEKSIGKTHFFLCWTWWISNALGNVWWQNWGKHDFVSIFSCFFAFNYHQFDGRKLHCQSCFDSLIGSMTLPLTCVVYTGLFFFVKKR